MKVKYKPGYNASTKVPITAIIGLKKYHKKRKYIILTNSVARGGKQSTCPQAFVILNQIEQRTRWHLDGVQYTMLHLKCTKMLTLFLLLLFFTSPQRVCVWNMLRRQTC